MTAGLPLQPVGAGFTPAERARLRRWAAAALRDLETDVGGDVAELALIGPRGARGWAEWALGREASGKLRLHRLPGGRGREWTVSSVRAALARIEAAEAGSVRPAGASVP